MNSVGDDLPSFCVQSPSYSPVILVTSILPFSVRAPEAKMYKKAAGKKFQQAISCQWRLAGFFRQKLPFLLQEEVVRRHRLRNTAFGRILGWGEFLVDATKVSFSPTLPVTCGCGQHVAQCRLRISNLNLKTLKLQCGFCMFLQLNTMLALALIKSQLLNWSTMI